MAVFILTWNPKRWEWPSRDFENAVEATARHEVVRDRWSAGLRRSGMSVGDRAFLLRQRDSRGIVASGIIASEVVEDQHWADPRRTTTFVEVEWDSVLPVEDRVPVEDLKRAIPAVVWDRIQGSGIKLAPPSDSELEKLWIRHRGGRIFRSPEELPPEDTYHEGAVARVEVNRYERDGRARLKCIERWGASCAVCGVDFAERYGKIGEGFIHVHHLHEVSKIGKEYRVDPITDLRPVCPNCHAMLHRAQPMLTVEELKERLKRR